MSSTLDVHGLTEADWNAIDAAIEADLAPPAGDPVGIWSEFRTAYRQIGPHSHEAYDELFYFGIWPDGKRHEFFDLPPKWSHLHRGFASHDFDRLQRAVNDAGKRADEAITTLKNEVLA